MSPIEYLKSELGTSLLEDIQQTIISKAFRSRYTLARLERKYHRNHSFKARLHKRTRRRISNKSKNYNCRMAKSK